MVQESLVVDEGVKKEVQIYRDNNFVDLAKEKVVLREFFRTKGSSLMHLDKNGKE